jgi:hypothetical protein
MAETSYTQELMRSQRSGKILNKIINNKTSKKII